MSAQLFDFLNAINFDKTNLLSDEANLKVYSPYIINKGLSFNQDTVLYANEMNIHWQVPKEAHFNFLKGVIPKKKRFSKWAKAENIEDLDLIQEYYGYSHEKARVALKLLNGEQIEAIRVKLDKGGRK